MGTGAVPGVVEPQFLPVGHGEGQDVRRGGATVDYPASVASRIGLSLIDAVANQPHHPVSTPPHSSLQWIGARAFCHCTNCRRLIICWSAYQRSIPVRDPDPRRGRPWRTLLPIRSVGDDRSHGLRENVRPFLHDRHALPEKIAGFVRLFNLAFRFMGQTSLGHRVCDV